MHIISGSTVSEVVLNAYNRIINEGHYRPSRNGGCSSIFDTTFQISNPRSRHLFLHGRKSNIFAMIAETFWVMAGEDALEPYLSFFLPRAPQYSDDGEYWHGAYGPRIYSYDQHLDALNAFNIDDWGTRRSFITIGMPNMDSQCKIELLYGTNHKAKDVPCNREIHFYVEGDNQFCAKTIQRSGDIIFGTGSINPFEFSFLHELMFNEVKKIHPHLELGAYRWHVTNAHLYDFSKDQAIEAAGNTQNYHEVSKQNHIPLIGPSVNKWQEFFKDLVDQYSNAIVSDDPEQTIGSLISHVGHTFIEYDVPMENNLMWTYSQLVAHYIAAKRNIQITPKVDLRMLPAELTKPIMESSFRKFEVIF